MKKIGIITIYDLTNFGNRLQNYALFIYLKGFNVIVYTIGNRKLFINSFFTKMKTNIGNIIKTFRRDKDDLRFLNFVKFEKNIKYYKEILDINSPSFSVLKYFNYFIVGSDQVWNPNFSRLSNVDLLAFANSSKKISYAASFGVNNIDGFINDALIENFDSFKAISVREDDGKKIINDMLPSKDVEVLIDPTMLLSADEWDKVSLKPKILKNDKFIFNYFLGELSVDRRNEIERIAEENNCEIINILDKNSPFYECGPSEFLWLEKHAFLICTDSFHSSVFAVLYNRPFIIFDREQEGMAKMNSRLDTLISKFNLKNRKFEGKITEENLNHDYSEAYKILEIERQKSKDFLERALDIKK